MLRLLCEVPPTIVRRLWARAAPRAAPATGHVRFSLHHSRMQVKVGAWGMADGALKGCQASVHKSLATRAVAPFFGGRTFFGGRLERGRGGRAEGRGG